MRHIILGVYLKRHPKKTVTNQKMNSKSPKKMHSKNAKKMNRTTHRLPTVRHLLDLNQIVNTRRCWG